MPPLTLNSGYIGPVFLFCWSGVGINPPLALNRGKEKPRLVVRWLEQHKRGLNTAEADINIRFVGLRPSHWNNFHKVFGFATGVKRESKPQWFQIRRRGPLCLEG